MTELYFVLTRLATSLLRYDRYPGHVPITSLSFSPDGHFLVSACPVNSVMLVSQFHYHLEKSMLNNM